jgi:hypothetical protein
MTPSKLLGGLKGIDPETYEALRNYPIYCSGEGALTVNLLESRNHVLVADALRGCSRSTKKRGRRFLPSASNIQTFRWMLDMWRKVRRRWAMGGINANDG